MKIKVEANDIQEIQQFLNECQDGTRLWATIEFPDGNSIKIETSKEEVEINESKVL